MGKQNDFSACSLAEQWQLLQQKGVYLARRKVFNLQISLYQVEGYYAEVFRLEENGQMIRIDVFDETDWLHPYLQMVDLEELKKAS